MLLIGLLKIQVLIINLQKNGVIIGEQYQLKINRLII